MRFCFGPVPSRRLGRSLGVDILPRKTCNLNCIYCELGQTKTYACERREYVPHGEICEEMNDLLRGGGPDFDTLTITASGEPTLHSSLGEILACAKRISKRPVAVLTNGTMLWDPAVREELSAADILLPSLDAVRARTFRKVDRPALCVRHGDMVDGLSALRREYAGRIWIEVLLVKGVNDGVDDLSALIEALALIRPDRVQLNTVARPPAVSWARPLTGRELEEARDFLGRGLDVPVEVVFDTRKRLAEGFHPLIEREILEMLARRPMQCEELEGLFSCGAEPVRAVISGLLSIGRIREEEFKDRIYYRVAAG